MCTDGQVAIVCGPAKGVLAESGQTFPDILRNALLTRPHGNANIAQTPHRPERRRPAKTSPVRARCRRVCARRWGIYPSPWVPVSWECSTPGEEASDARHV